jgi:fucose 4-O-acetylase-like acetyltransferase
MPQRIDWIDFAKGIGIILVVVGHAGRGLSNAGIPDEGGLLPLIDHAIYAFHMPLFFVLAGVTFGMRPPVNIQPALIKRSWRIFYALVVWTYAFLFMQALAGDASNAGTTWENVLVWPLPPFAHFWFLWALLLNMVVFAVLRLALRPTMSDLKFWSVAFAATGVANFIVSMPDALIPFLTPALNYSLAFAVGGLIGASSLIRTVPSWPVATLAAASFALCLWTWVYISPSLHYVMGGSFLALLLIVPLVTLSNRYGQSKWARFLVFLGMISLAIYVMHTMFSALIRIVLLKGGTDDLTLHLVLGISIGIIGPLLVYLGARRFGLLRIAGLA